MYQTIYDRYISVKSPQQIEIFFETGKLVARDLAFEYARMVIHRKCSVGMLHSSDVMLQGAREANTDQKDIQVVQEGASSAHCQIFN